MIVISDLETIRIVADERRQRIIEVLHRRELASATTIAEEMGESAPKISYHLKLLEKHGLVELAETRTRGNLIENLYAPTARRFTLAPEVVPGVNDAGEYIPEALELIQTAISKISADLLELPKVKRQRNFASTISYDTYYLTREEIEVLRKEMEGRLITLARQHPGEDRLACKLGFLLVDVKQDPNSTKS